MIRIRTECTYAVIALAVITGCSSILGDRSKEPIKGVDTKAMRTAGYSFDERGAQRALPTGDGGPAVVLEIRDRKRHFERVPLPVDKPTLVQDIVDDAKLVDRLGRIHVTILRPTGKNSPPVRMVADFDNDTKRIVPSQNYAVQPGDNILIEPDTRSWLDSLSIFPKSSSR